jgi:hypothetical protein
MSETVHRNGVNNKWWCLTPIALPSYRAVLFVRAMVEHPAECVIFAPCTGDNAAAFRRPVALGIRNSLTFRGCIPTAHTLTYLRFAHAVTDTSARLATDPPGSALVGRVSHPLDDSSKFPEVFASFLSIGPASLGRTKPSQLFDFKPNQQ